MTENAQTTTIGNATVTVIDLYDIPSKLSELVDAPADERTPADTELLERTENLAVQCILVRLGEVTVLVDAGAYEAALDSSGRANYEPAPSLVDALADLGVSTDDVNHVVITHAHGDHFNGTTFERDGEYDPTFPNARVHLGRGDWERMQEAFNDPVSLETRTFGVLHREELLELVDEFRELGDGVTILAAPGETPGHLIVRVHSEGQTLYCVGDLYHHPIEVDHPTWMVPWADRAANIQSRQSLADAALGEKAVIVATHISGIGRLRATRVEWVTVS